MASWDQAVSVFPLEYCLLSSCLLICGCRRAAVGPNITSTLQVGRKVEEGALVPPISSYQKSKTFPEIPKDSLYFTDKNCHVVIPGCRGDWKSGYLSRKLVDLTKIGVPFTRQIEGMVLG